MTQFRQLNENWNADPNAPQPTVKVVGADIVLSFRMNYHQFPHFQKDDIGVLRFFVCARYRLGAPNDEGWYLGQCRFSKIAPRWGEFYELTGDLRLEKSPSDWIELSSREKDLHHFLFYFRDDTFECEAAGWSFEVQKK